MVDDRATKYRESLAATRELRRRSLDDPEVRERARQVLEEIANGEEPKSPGLTAETLLAFLREHNARVDPDGESGSSTS